MNKKGFTLVELLAVIAILAILVIIAMPNVLDIFNGAKKSTFVTEVQTIYKQAEQQYIRDSLSGSTSGSYSSEGTNKIDVTTTKNYTVTVTQNGITSITVWDGSYCYKATGTPVVITDITEEAITEGDCPSTNS